MAHLIANICALQKPKGAKVFVYTIQAEKSYAETLYGLRLWARRRWSRIVLVAATIVVDADDLTCTVPRIAFILIKLTRINEMVTP